MADIQLAIDLKTEKERQDELDALRKGGRVKNFFRLRELKRLERAVHQKASTGPLNLTMSEQAAVKRSGRRLERFRTDGVQRWVAGIRAVGGHRAMKDSQKKELEALESMGLVQKGVASKDMERLTARMFNVFLKRGKREDRAAICVTGYEEEAKDNVAEMIRQQSEVVVSNLFNFPSRNRRVLNRLSSIQRHNIEDTEQRKGSGGFRPNKRWPVFEKEGILPDSCVSAAGEGEEEEEEGWRQKVRWTRRKKKATFGYHDWGHEVDTKRHKRRPKSSGDDIIHTHKESVEDRRKYYASTTSKSFPNLEDKDKDDTEDVFDSGDVLRTDADQSTQLPMGQQFLPSSPLATEQEGELDDLAFDLEGDQAPQLGAVDTWHTNGFLDAGSPPQVPMVPFAGSPLPGSPVPGMAVTARKVASGGGIIDGGFTLFHPFQEPPPLPSCSAALDIMNTHRDSETLGPRAHEEENLLAGRKISEDGATDSRQWSVETVEKDSVSLGVNGTVLPMDSELEYLSGARSPPPTSRGETPLEDGPEYHAHTESRQDSVASSEPSVSDSRDFSVVRNTSHGFSLPNGIGDVLSSPPPSKQVGSLDSSFDEQLSINSTSQRIRRFVSSPQMSVPSVNSATSTPFPSLINTCTPHGSYHVLRPEDNPFATQFTAALEGRMTGLMQQRSEVRRDLSASTASSQNHDLPRNALQDSGFMEYVTILNRKPKRSDYISYKIAMIGDQIDKKYDLQLNEAFEDLFPEVWKSTMSWESFSFAARRLLFQGRKVQDGIFMIPCFGRRVLEGFPHMKAVITTYTQQVLETYAGNWILEYGGLGQLMEHFSQAEIDREAPEWEELVEEVVRVTEREEDEEEDLYSPEVLDTPWYTCGKPGGMMKEAGVHTFPRTHGAPVLSNKVWPTRFPGGAASLDVPEHRLPPTASQVFLTPLTADCMPAAHIRRIKSVEVLFPETSSEEDVMDFFTAFSEDQLPRRRHSFCRWLSTDSADVPPERTLGFHPGASTPVPIPPRPSHRSDATLDGTPATPRIISVGSGGQPITEHIGIVAPVPLESSPSTLLLPADKGYLSLTSEQSSNRRSISMSPEPSTPLFMRPRGWSDSSHRGRHSGASSTSPVGATPLPPQPVQMEGGAIRQGDGPAGTQPCERSNTGSSGGDYLDLGFEPAEDPSSPDKEEVDDRPQPLWQTVVHSVVDASPILTHTLLATGVAALIWFQRN